MRTQVFRFKGRPYAVTLEEAIALSQQAARVIALFKQADEQEADRYAEQYPDTDEHGRCITRNEIDRILSERYPRPRDLRRHSGNLYGRCIYYARSPLLPLKAYCLRCGLDVVEKCALGGHHTATSVVRIDVRTLRQSLPDILQGKVPTLGTVRLADLTYLVERL